MVAHKVFIENEDGVLIPYGGQCGFLYSRTETNKRREGYGPFCCFDTLESVLYEIPWLATEAGNYKHVKVFSVEIDESNDEHIWTPGNRLPLSNGKLEHFVILADTFKLVEQITLPNLKKAHASMKENRLARMADVVKKSKGGK